MKALTERRAALVKERIELVALQARSVHGFERRHGDWHIGHIDSLIGEIDYEIALEAKRKANEPAEPAAG